VEAEGIRTIDGTIVGVTRLPHRIRDPDSGHIGDPPGYCCFCGELTISGIFTRADPDTTLCRGKHAEEQA